MGLIIVTNSLLTLIVGIIGIIWNVLTPFSEEPWLGNLYGDKYNEYCKKVRRFF
jgi:protein-S-isoprenylcysteine O-methyltransferase Ste14